MINSSRADIQSFYSDHKYHSIGGCGISKNYLDDYSKVKDVNKEYFKEKYNDVILKCKQKYYREVEKYDPVMASRIKTVKEKMQLMWDSSKWKNYE